MTGDFDPRDPIALTQALIRCRSVTPEEGGALALVARVLGEAGFSVRRLTFSEPGTAPVDNLYARIGPPGPAFLFAGHTDVVPPGDAARWSYGPFEGAIVGGEIHGRGAADMKGGVAASIAAAIRHLDAGPPAEPIAFLLTGDEEGPAVNGTVKLLAWAREHGESFSACLLAEPTNREALGDMIKIGRRGSLSGVITVRGRQGHVAYPHLADNPLPRLVSLLAALTAEPLDQGTAHFDASNLELTSIDVGNSATNVIPAEAQAAFNIRFNDLWTQETLAAWVRRRLDSTGHACDLVFRDTNAEAFLTAPGPFVERVAKAVEAETGRRPVLSTSGGTSDARFIKDACPVVEFGLVGKTMHQVDERVSIADLEKLTRIFQRVLAAGA